MNTLKSVVSDGLPCPTNSPTFGKYHTELLCAEDNKVIFIPEGRRDTKYCSVPQDSGKLCSEIGPRLKYAKKIENDPDYQDHHREMSKLHMALKREKDSGAEGSENLIPTIIEKIEKEKENFKAKMRLNKEVK